MVHGYITVFLLGPLKKREVHDPEEIELVVVDEAKILSQFQAQSTQFLSAAKKRRSPASPPMRLTSA